MSKSHSHKVSSKLNIGVSGILQIDKKHVDQYEYKDIQSLKRTQIDQTWVFSLTEPQVRVGQNLQNLGQCQDTSKAFIIGQFNAQHFFSQPLTGVLTSIVSTSSLFPKSTFSHKKDFPQKKNMFLVFRALGFGASGACS